MSAKLFAAAVAVACIGWLLGCARREPSGSRAEAARRIVSLAPSTTEGLFAIGAGERVVGRSRFCDYPPQARTLPIVGDVDPDLEAVVELHPDLVVGLAGLVSSQLQAKLAARGIRAWFPESRSLAAIDDVLLGLGERSAHSEEARRLTAALDAREAAIARSVAAEPRPKVLLVVSSAPVIAAGPQSFAGELISAAGGENVVGGDVPWPTVGFERIADLDPDVILDATDVTPGVTAITPHAPGWSELRAVRQGHVLLIRDERVLRAGPRIAEGLAVLARLLHPRAAIEGD